MNLQETHELFSQALFDPEALVAAVSSVREVTGAQTAQFLTVGEDGIPSSVFAGELDPCFSALEPEYWEINPRARAAGRMSVGRAVRDFDFVGRDEIQTNRAYQELLIPAGLANFSGVLCHKTKENFAALAIFRGEPEGIFSDTSVRLLEAVSGIVGSVVQTGLFIEHKAARYGLSLSATQDPAALLDKDLNVVDWNNSFGDLISRNEILISRTGRAQILGSDFTYQLSKIAAGPISQLVQKFVVRDTFGRIRYIAELNPVPGTLRIGYEARRYTILRLNPYTPPELNTALAQSAFALTDAEVAVLGLIVLGYEIQEIADERRTSVHTVRTQIKRILEKADSKRQIDLVRFVVKHFSM